MLHDSQTGMPTLEYFRLIDRHLGIRPRRRTIRAEAIVPTQSTIFFEGHFPATR